MADDILLEARGNTSHLRDEFSRAEKDIDQSLERISDAADQIDLDGAGEGASTFAAEIEEAARTGQDALDGLNDAVEEYVSTSSRAGSAGESLASGTRQAQEAQEQLADSAREAAKGLGELSDRTFALSDTGAEGPERIANAWARLDESIRQAGSSVGLADKAFDELGSSPAEFLAEAGNETEKLVILLADATKNIRQMEEESREGLSGFADRTAKASQRLQELRDIIEQQGDHAVPELIDELERLERQYVETFSTGRKRAAELEASIEAQEDDLKRLKLGAQGTSGEMIDLTEAIRLRFPKAAKAIGSAVAAMAAFKASFEATRGFIDFLDANFGIDIDRLVTRFLGLEQIMGRIIGVTDSAETTFLNLGNQLRVMAASGVDVSKLEKRFQALEGAVKNTSGEIDIQGQSLETLAALVAEANKAWEEYEQKQRDIGTAAEAARIAVGKLGLEAQGIQIEPLSDEFTKLSDAARLLETTARDSQNLPLFQEWRDDAAELRDQLESMPPVVRRMFEAASKTSAEDAIEALDTMAGKLDLIIDNTEEAAKAALEHAKAQKQAARQAGDAWETVADKLLDVARLQNEALPEAPGIDPEVSLQNVEEARQRLQELERQIKEIDSSPTISLEEGNNRADLLGQVTKARQELARLEAQVPITLDTTDLGQQAARALREGLDDANFEEAFRNLSKTAQLEISTLISELDGLIQSGARLDPDLIESYGAAIDRALGGQAAKAAEALGEAFDGLVHTDVVDRLAEIAKESQGAADPLAALEGATVKVAEGLEEAGQAAHNLDLSRPKGEFQEAETAAKDLKVQLERTAEGWSLVNEEAKGTGAQEGTQQLNHASRALDEFKPKLERTAEGWKLTNTEAEAAADSVVKFTRAGVEFTMSTEGMSQAAIDLALGIEKDEVRIEKLGDKLVVTNTKAREAAQSLNETGEAAKNLGDGIEIILGSDEALASYLSGVAEESDKTSVKVEKVGETFRVVNEKAGEAGNAVGETNTALQETESAASTGARGLDQVTTSAAAAAEPLRTTATAAEEAAGPLATLAANAGDAGTQLGTVADASERIVTATGVPEAITATAEAAVAAAPGVGQLAEQATAVASAVETVAEKGKELPDTLSQWGAGAETLAGQLQPLNEGALGEHRTVVAETATAYRDTVTAQQELGTQIGTLAGQLTTLQEQFDNNNEVLDQGIEKHRDYDRSLDETVQKLDELKTKTEDTHKALADLVDPEVLGRLGQLNASLGAVATNLVAVKENALAAAEALAQVPQ